jgi:hypothetical protein
MDIMDEIDISFFIKLMINFTNKFVAINRYS